MRITRVAIPVMLFALLPVFGSAQEQFTYTAELSAPSKQQGTVFASGIRWECRANTCTTRGPWPTPGVNACAALQSATGASITTYGHPGRRLSKQDLAECNASTASAAAAVKIKPEVMMRLAKPEPAQIKPMAPPAAGKQSAAPGAAAPPPAPRSYPVPVRTLSLVVTGIGLREAAEDTARRSAFTPRSVRTTGLTVTGIGLRETAGDTAGRAAFVPRNVRTIPLTVSGTGHR